jgi:hypothetical protein
VSGEYPATYRGVYEASWGAEVRNDTSTRKKIISDFSEWAAFSATRSGCPIKARDAVYPLIRTPKYESVLNGMEISAPEFNDWHRKSTLAICSVEPLLPIGWAAKIINIYLKTMVYLAGVGRLGLVACIHPPIDNGLWEGIYSEYRHRRDIISKTHIVNRIKYCVDRDVGPNVSLEDVESYGAVKGIHPFQKYFIMFCGLRCIIPEGFQHKVVNLRRKRPGKGIIDSKGGFGIPGTKTVNYFGLVSPASIMSFRDWMGRSGKGLCAVRIDIPKATSPH